MSRTTGAELRPLITELQPDEPARFNPDRLEELCHLVGEVRAEARVVAQIKLAPRDRVRRPRLHQRLKLPRL